MKTFENFNLKKDLISELSEITTSKPFLIWMKELNGGVEQQVTTDELIGGYCEDLAFYLHYRYKLSIYKVDSAEVQDGHYFVKYDNLYFDAKNPTGVTKPSDFEWAKKSMKTFDTTPEIINSNLEKFSEKPWSGYSSSKFIVKIYEKIKYLDSYDLFESAEEDLNNARLRKFITTDMYNDISLIKIREITITYDSEKIDTYYYNNSKHDITLIFIMKPIINYVCVNRDNPGLILIPLNKKTKADALSNFKWFYEENVFVHEITHLDDYKRNVPTGDYWDKERNDINLDKYYISDIENNAFFIGGVAGIIQDPKIKSKLDKFNIFYNYSLKHFNSEYVDAHLEFNPKRFKSRLYKIFDELRNDDQYFMIKNKQTLLDKIKKFFHF